MHRITYALLALLATPLFSHAQYEGDIPKAFQNVILVPEQAVTVPTVVALPVLITPGQRTQFAVYEQNSDTYIPNHVTTEYAVHPTPLMLTANGMSMPALIDTNTETYSEFPVDEQRENSVRLTVSASAPVTSSSLWLGLEPYVALPTRVSVTVFENGQERVVVSPRVLTDTTISFPETTATSWTLTLYYTQPLRMNEVRLVEEGVEETVNHTLRFLAQPGYAYRVYTHPDRQVLIPTGDAGNLTDNSGIVTLPPYPENINHLYQEADSDADDVPDFRDNCTTVANADQSDLDRNGRGDVCDDYDRDGYREEVDNCPRVPNYNQADEDGDGIGDVCDGEESRVTEKYPWIPWAGMGIAVLVLGALFVLVAVAPKREEEKV